MPASAPPTFALHSIRDALALHHPQSIAPEPRDHSAAVALVLAGGSDLSLCVIRRAERADDPWSGHLAFPGGRQDPGDRDSQATAERETLEEVGLDVRRGEFLGALSQVLVRGRVPGWRMILSPFVYSLGETKPPLPPATKWPPPSGSR